jgi:hypothetical protein
VCQAADSQPCLPRMIMAACFIPGRPVLPILFKYRYKHFNVGWGIVNVYWHIYRLMTQFINHCEVITIAFEKNQNMLRRALLQTNRFTFAYLVHQ